MILLKLQSKENERKNSKLSDVAVACTINKICPGSESASTANCLWVELAMYIFQIARSSAGLLHFILNHSLDI